ncbi:MAG: hypothetical protein MJ105_03325 [Lachnospiraceae bacterium]|nr:hypothetical protein [Lachnospiraceae bacterium]
MVRKKIAYILGFIALFFICFLCFHKIFSFKDGDGSFVMKSFYELEDNSVDVLILGTSHVFEGINPAILWEDLGVTSYDLCGSMTPMWNSYYYLEEALKKQTPQLVILDAFSLVPVFEEFSHASKYIKNTFGLRPSETKINAIKETTGEEWVSYALEYMQYHNRYSELSDIDFYPYRNDEPMFGTWLGYARNYTVLPFEEQYYDNQYMCMDLVEKEEEYYRKIITLCQEEEIPLLIIAVPYAGYSEADMYFMNSGAMIAEELGVPFVDFNLYRDVLGVDASTDYADFNHLSYIGSDRFTHYLARYLAANYVLPTHNKSDAKYMRWNQAYAYYVRDNFNHDIRLVEDVDSYWNLLHSLPNTYEIIINVPGKYNAENSTNVNDMTTDSDNAESSTKTTEVWLLRSGNASLLTETRYGYYYKKQLGHNELVVDENVMLWKREEIQFPSHAGTKVMVFDVSNQCVVDAVVIEKNVIYRVTEE